MLTTGETDFKLFSGKGSELDDKQDGKRKSVVAHTSEKGICDGSLPWGGAGVKVKTNTPGGGVAGRSLWEDIPGKEKHRASRTWV